MQLLDPPAGASLRSIANRLGRAASTVSRELRRNGGQRRYRDVGRQAEVRADCASTHAVAYANWSPR
ncbi:MAG TPA: helix-turn-helix domain-containing protein [Croceibacterium sp.]|nr:helix-turn-helix domain-containing protein [Croceibacterium sp.]